MSQSDRKRRFLFFMIPTLCFLMISCSCSELTDKPIKNPDLHLEINVTPIDEEKAAFSTEEMISIKAIMKKRIDSLGASSNSISIQEQNLLIDILGYTDLEEVKSVLGKPGKLTFTDEQGSLIVTGDHIKKITYTMQARMEGGVQEPIIKLEMDEEGKRLFADGTRRNIGKTITINLDDEVLMAPVVHDTITNGVVILTFGGDKNEALHVTQKTAALLKGGAIPAVITIIKAEIR